MFETTLAKGQAWLQRPEPGFLASLCGAATARVASARRRTRTKETPECTTLVVGSLSMGGSGKTEVVRMLAAHCSSQLKVSVVTRGYRAKSKMPREVMAPDFSLFGDEASWLRRALPQKIRVWAGSDLEATRERASRNADLVIVDDGFQSPLLKRTFSMVVLDATGSRRVFPAGPWRESIDALADANWIWLHKVDEPGAQAIPEPYMADFESRYVITKVTSPSGCQVGPGWLRGRSIRPICGIARPQSFLSVLKKAGAFLREGASIVDHGRFSAQLLSKIPSDVPWVTTAKDAERWPVGWPVWTVEVDARLVSGTACLCRVVDAVSGG